MRRSFLALASLLTLAACSGAGGGSNPDGGAGSDSGTSGEGGGVGACTATTTPSTLLPDAQYAHSLSVVGNDVYWIDANLGTGTILKTGLIQHIKTDGTGLSTVVTPTAVTYGATALGDDIFYFQEDDSSNSAIHLYRAPRAGGVGTQLGTAVYNGFGAALINASLSFGVFAKRGTDVFISDGKEISRVSTTSGAKTVIAATANGSVMWPHLVGGTIFFTQLVDGQIFSVSPDATTPSAVRLGTTTCGQTRSLWMSAHSSGFVCGALFGIDKVDATGTTSAHLLDTMTDKDPTGFNPSPVDGTTFYAFPRQTTTHGGVVTKVPLLKMDAVAGNPSAVACDVGFPREVAMSATDLVWLEERKDSNAAPAQHTMKRIAR